MKTLFFALGLATLGLGGLGCQPRGETKTLEEVLRGAEVRFERVLGAAGPNAARLEAVTTSLRTVADALKGFRTSGSGIATDHYLQIGQTLSDLSSHAGYTSRPALGELADQWLGLTAAVDAPSTRLLMSRTYEVLASELEGVGFAIQ